MQGPLGGAAWLAGEDLPSLSSHAGSMPPLEIGGLTVTERRAAPCFARSPVQALAAGGRRLRGPPSERPRVHFGCSCWRGSAPFLMID